MIKTTDPTTKLALLCAFLLPLDRPASQSLTTGHCSFAQRRHPPGPAGSGRAQTLPAGYCQPPTSKLTKTERSPISRSARPNLVLHRTGRSLRRKQTFPSATNAECGMRNPAIPSEKPTFSSPHAAARPSSMLSMPATSSPRREKEKGKRKKRVPGHLHRTRRAVKRRDHARKGVGSNGGRPQRGYPR